jgi:hypothetical protein
MAFTRWEDGIRSGLRAMHERGELRADPDRLATALLAAVQGGLLLTQVRRDTNPLEVAIDAMLDHIDSVTAHVPSKTSREARRKRRIRAA